MRYVKVTPGDSAVDVDEYLERLPSLAGDLPDGARVFATDPGHYDYVGKRCVKDLKLRGVLFNDSEQPSIDLDFQHNCWKHEDDLTIHYTGVTAFAVDMASGESWRQWHGGVVVDEVVPAAGGCTHELVFLNGSMTITARDLTAVWFEAECPGKD
ncbi:hypothetical protein [Actinocrispum sp. NPDC049592]|uniref:hypothetical protein n=1 Tax=Actinocrispum sp. NPDC049592 TaxID=3154835 RepID=UPI00342F5C88